MVVAQIAWWALVLWFAFVGLSQILDINKPPKPITNLGGLRGVLIGVAEIAALLVMGQPTHGWSWVWWVILGMAAFGAIVIVSQIGKKSLLHTPGRAAITLATDALLVLGLYAIRPF